VSAAADSVRFHRRALEAAAAGQRAQWQIPAAALHDLNRGFWRALTENAGVTAVLEFAPGRHIVTVRRG
jgi:hypothetical protein